MNRLRWIEKLEQWPQSAVLGAIFGMGLICRILVIVAFPEIGDPNTMDTQNYLQLAHNLAETGRFEMWNQPSAYVAPGYPFFLATVFKIFGENLLAVKLIQAVLGAATAVLVYFLALRMSRPAVALIAASLMAVHPELLGITGFIYTEVLFVFLLVATLLLLARAVQLAKPIYFVQAGLLFGLTTLCRGTTLYFPLILLGVILFSSQRRLWLRRWAMFVVGMMAMMAPWTIRNYYHFGVFLPVAAGSGDVFWTGNNLEFDGEYRYQATQAKLLEVAGNVDQITRDRLLLKDAKEKILAEPLPHAWLFARKIFRYWLRIYENVPHGEARQRHWLVFGVLAATHYTILLLAIIGLRQCRWQIEINKLLIAFVCYYTLVHAATLAVARYRIPLLPLISLASASGVLWLLQKMTGKEPSLVARFDERHQAEVDFVEEENRGF